MKKEVLQKTIEAIREHNEDLYALIKKINKDKKAKKREPQLEEVQEALILVSILLSGNIKVRYDLEEYTSENKAFANLNTIKSISANCKQDIDALKAISFSLVEVLKSIKHKEEQKRYKDETL